MNRTHGEPGRYRKPPSADAQGKKTYHPRGMRRIHSLEGGAVTKLSPVDWKTDGGALWLINMAASFCGLDECMKELKEQVFAGQTGRSL